MKTHPGMRCRQVSEIEVIYEMTGACPLKTCFRHFLCLEAYNNSFYIMK